ncbi:MAG: DedA family protein [Planctomycetota bacterium]|nr:DedA family protein [Planctomycetota bacterium]
MAFDFQILFESYGPFAVFLLLMLSGIGIPLGEDVIIIPAGALVQARELPLKLTFVMAYLGVVLADFTWFTIISRYGTLLLHQRWLRKMIHPRRLLQAKHQIDKRGAWMIVFARFIPGSRSSAITAAAMLHMPFWKFAMATSICVLFTVPIQMGLGWLIAMNLGTENTASLVMRLIGLLMLLIACVFVWGLIKKHRESKKGAPRAKAKWLRKFRMPRRRKSDTDAITPPETSVSPESSAPPEPPEPPVPSSLSESNASSDSPVTPQSSKAHTTSDQGQP